MKCKKSKTYCDIIDVDQHTHTHTHTHTNVTAVKSCDGPAVCL